MTSQGSPYARLRRAIATGNAHLAWVAAAELDHSTRKPSATRYSAASARTACPWRRDRAEAIADPDRGDAHRELVGERYDSAERRLALAAQLEGVADAETIEARVVSDTNHVRPAAEALADGGPSRASAARRTRGKSGQVRSQPPRRSERGR